MALSINTNRSAMIAMQALSAVNAELDVTQRRVSTGLKVSSAKDDPATWGIAQRMRGDLSGLSAVKKSLDRARSSVDVALTAAESISDVLIEMKEKAVAAADSGLDAQSRQAIQDDYNALAKQVASYLNQAEFNGSNILKSGGASVSAITNANASGSLEVANQALDFNGGGMGDGALVKVVSSGSAVTVNWADGAAAKTSADDIEAAIKAMNKTLSTLGSAAQRIDRQQEFTTKLSDTIESGIGNLVDADLARESARLTALQTKQQLSVQALSIANQMPQSILSLFR